MHNNTQMTRVGEPSNVPLYPLPVSNRFSC